MTPITQIPANAQLVIVLRAHTDEGSIITAIVNLDDYEKLSPESPVEAFSDLVRPIDDRRFDELDLNTFSLTLLVPITEDMFNLIPMARVPGMPMDQPEADQSRAMFTLVLGVKDTEVRKTFIEAMRRIKHQRHGYLLDALNYIQQHAEKLAAERAKPNVDGDLGGS